MNLPVLGRPDGARAQFLADVWVGLGAHPKRLPSKYFYDARGSRLFEGICKTADYYVTRTENNLLAARANDLAAEAGRGRTLIEPGSGKAQKVQLIAQALAPRVYVPIEICAEYLAQSVETLSIALPWLPVLPVCADFAALWDIPLPPEPRLIFFPGSTLGNFEPQEAVQFLLALRRLGGDGGALLIGIDLKKKPVRLERAYNDIGGITAAFNRNLLERINRELDADFVLRRFRHRAFYNDAKGRMEMHLVSGREQHVTISGRMFSFAAGESIHTENSYKYTVEEFQSLASKAGWKARRVWTDPAQHFSVHYLVAGSCIDGSRPAILRQ